MTRKGTPQLTELTGEKSTSPKLNLLRVLGKASLRRDKATWVLIEVLF
jgi:hypothetical protein